MFSERTNKERNREFQPVSNFRCVFLLCFQNCLSFKLVFLLSVEPLFGLSLFQSHVHITSDDIKFQAGLNLINQALRFSAKLVFEKVDKDLLLLVLVVTQDISSIRIKKHRHLNTLSWFLNCLRCYWNWNKTRYQIIAKVQIVCIPAPKLLKCC